MAAKSNRRKYVHRPGLAAAAEQLGCTYSHLRRVVMGERITPLLDRYHALATNKPNTTKQNEKLPYRTD